MNRFAKARFRALTLALALGVNVLSLHSARPQPPAIRAFDLETTERLGAEIQLQDQLAWVATDVLLAKVTAAELQKQGAGGWVVDAKGRDDGVVRFVRTQGQSVEAAYDVVFAPGKAPVLNEPKDRQLTAEQARRFDALKQTEKAFLAVQRPWCGGRPNSVVVKDPEGSGYLVYLLRPKPAENEVPVGGHYRITVSTGAKTDVRVDQLFVSCLTMNKNQVPAGAKTEAMVVSQIVAELPLETVVFLSLQEKLPIAVVGPSGKTWMVKDGHIRPLENVAPKSR